MGWFSCWPRTGRGPCSSSCATESNQSCRLTVTSCKQAAAKLCFYDLNFSMNGSCKMSATASVEMCYVLMYICSHGQLCCGQAGANIDNSAVHGMLMCTSCSILAVTQQRVLLTCSICSRLCCTYAGKLCTHACNAYSDDPKLSSKATTYLHQTMMHMMVER